MSGKATCQASWMAHSRQSPWMFDFFKFSKQRRYAKGQELFRYISWGSATELENSISKFRNAGIMVPGCTRAGSSILLFKFLNSTWRWWHCCDSNILVLKIAINTVIVWSCWNMLAISIGCRVLFSSSSCRIQFDLILSSDPIFEDACFLHLITFQDV